MEQNVIPFLEELKHHLGEQQFSFAPQIEMNDHRPVGVSFRIGDGAPTSITTAFGNIVVTASVIAGLPKAFPLSMRPTLNLIFRTQAISRAIRLQSSLRWLSIRLGAEADSAIPNLSGFGRPRRSVPVAENNDIAAPWELFIPTHHLGSRVALQLH